MWQTSFFFPRLLSFNIMFSGFIHVVAGLISFHGWIIFHCIALPHFIYPFICWWAFGMFAPFGYYEQCCHKCLCESLNVDIGFHFSWIYIYIPSSGLAGSNDNCLTFWGTARLFQSGSTILHSHRQCMRVPISPHPL